MHNGVAIEAGDRRLALSDASNSIKLYQMMKEATEATFDIQREGGNVTPSVDLSSP